MSDFSIISHDYALSANFAKAFNEAVLFLKRFYLVGRPSEGANVDLPKVRDQLRSQIDSLVAALEDGEKPWSAERAQVPADVIEDLRKRLRGNLDSTLAGLRAVSEELRSDSQLNEDSFVPLDSVCDAADATASSAFRRLRRI